MIKFKYLGKKKNFKLDPVYAMQTPLNAGDVFELSGKDIVLMRRCIMITKEQSAGYSDFILCAEHDLKKAEAELDATAEEDERPTVSEDVAKEVADSEPAEEDVPADAIELPGEFDLTVEELRAKYKGKIKGVHVMKKETILKRIQEGV